jgi:hypothetical protein
LRGESGRVEKLRVKEDCSLGRIEPPTVPVGEFVMYKREA